MINLLKTKNQAIGFFLIVFLLAAGLSLSPRAPLARAADSSFILAWSANSYAPQWYEGKALPIRGSDIKVFALPIQKLSQNPDYLYYRWLLDGDVVGWAGGIGKSVFQFTAFKWAGDLHEIKTQILDSQQTNILSQASTYIQISSPKILLKAANSNYAAQESIATDTGLDLVLTAQPFFFQIEKASDLLFTWNLDGQELSSSDEKNPDQLTIKIPAGKLSQSVFKKLSLLVQNKISQIQQSSINLNVEIK